MKVIGPTTIAKLIEAHIDNDDEKFFSYANFIADAYEEQGKDNAAKIIRNRISGEYKTAPRVVLDSEDPCEDAINREKALAPYKDLNDDDVISVRLIKKNIIELPPVAPIGAKGHWISNNGYIWCSECNFRNSKRPNFCENCGAEMENVE